MLHCSFSLAAAQLLAKMTSALQKTECCSATSAAQHPENCSATSVLACGMLQGWGLVGEGQKGTPGRGQDRKCHDRASLSRPLVLSLEPLTSLASFPLFCTSEDIHGRGGGWPLTKWGWTVGGKGERFVMTFLGVQTPVGFFSTQFLRKHTLLPKNAVFKVLRCVEPHVGETKLLKLR